MTHNQPISSHPAFRWAVGLWFAALLGAGLFVMPDTVHATIRQSLGIEGILPADGIGRAALAGGAALFGLLLGLVLAGRVAALNAAREYDDDEVDYEETSWEEVEDQPAGDTADEPRRPFSPREFFGDDETEEQFEPEHDGYDEPEKIGIDEIMVDEGTVEEIAVEETPVEFAEFEPVVEDAEAFTQPTPEVEDTSRDEAAFEAGSEDGGNTQALGDLPLSALTQRLQRALDASRATADSPPSAEDGELDPVIAFLRREADRATPAPDEAGGEDAQAALRSALDRLSKVSNPR